MTIAARLRSWLRARFGRARLERAMDDEMRLHIDLYEADLVAGGVPADEARRRARAEFGSIAARKDECREAVGLRLLDDLRADVVYALRLLRRSPGFTVVALLSLALGIGANTAIFSLVDTVMMKSLPVHEPQRLFFVDNSGGKSGGNSGPPYPCFEVIRDNNRFLEGVSAFSEDRFKVTIDGPPEQVRGLQASGNFFDLLGVKAARGRLLTPEDDSVFGRGGPHGAAAVISYAFWKRRFGLDPGVVGRTIQIGTRPVTIVGVTEPDFFGLQTGSPIDITVPIVLSSSVRSTELWWMSVVARLKPDASVDQARADVEALWDGYMTTVVGWPPGKRGEYFTGIALVPAMKGLNALRRTYSEPLMIIMAIVAAVLLIGCANVANLLLARASARRSEMSVRLAIGAARGRLMRQLLTEAAVLVLLGTATGLLFAHWGVTFIVGLFGRNGQGILLEPVFDARVLAFTTAVASLTAILFSLAPALRATSTDAARPSSGNASSSPKSRTTLGRSLVVVQVALAVVLLSAAALFLRTLHQLNTIDAGFDRHGVLTMVVEATVPGGYVVPKTEAERSRDHARFGAIWEDFIARVGALPGVTSATVSTMSPLTGRDRGVVVAVIGVAPLPRPHRGIHVNQVTAGYFDTMGVRMLEGRPFTDRDRAGSPRVAILNETAARTYFGGTTGVVGRRINFPGQRVEAEYEVVGVARDMRYRNLREPDDRMAYLPIEQSLDPITMAAVAVRGPANVSALMPSIRTVVGQAIPGGFVVRVATTEQRVRDSLVRERMLSILATFFGGLALALACIGLYGTMAYAVIRRTREIGIRIAIGARHGSVVWMVVRDMLALVLVGAALGTFTALPASRFMKSQLFGVDPGDPLTVIAAIVVLFAVTAAAGYLPARRASRINPVTALRYE